MSQQLTAHLREFRKADIPAVVRINNAADPKVPISIEGFTAMEKARGTDPLGQWVIERDGGEVVAYCDCGITNGTAAENTFHVVVNVHPDHAGHGYGDLLFAKALEFTREHGIGRLVGACSEELPHSLAWVKKHGFEQIGHNAETLLTLSEATYLETADLGLELRTVKAEKERNDDVERDIYETLANPILQEIVLPGGAKIDMPYEQFHSMTFGRPDYDMEADILAVRDGEYVGWISALTGDRPYAYINFLGVRKDFEKKGLELALIQQACQGIADKGIAKIGTYIGTMPPHVIEEMQKIGFATQPGRIVWLKQLD